MGEKKLRDSAMSVVTGACKMSEVAYGDDGEKMAADILALFKNRDAECAARTRAEATAADEADALEGRAKAAEALIVSLTTERDALKQRVDDQAVAMTTALEWLENELFGANVRGAKHVLAEALRKGGE